MKYTFLSKWTVLILTLITAGLIVLSVLFFEFSQRDATLLPENGTLYMEVEEGPGQSATVEIRS